MEVRRCPADFSRISSATQRWLNGITSELEQNRRSRRRFSPLTGSNNRRPTTGVRTPDLRPRRQCDLETDIADSTSRSDLNERLDREEENFVETEILTGEDRVRIARPIDEQIGGAAFQRSSTPIAMGSRWFHFGQLPLLLFGHRRR